MTRKALLVIDVQNDFCKGGSLAVKDGENVVPCVNTLMEKGGYDVIVLSQDWHPDGHGSFASQHPGKKPLEMGELGGQPQVMWPDHCVQGSRGAEFHPGLKVELADYKQQKGTDKCLDSYSAFCENDGVTLTPLADYLKKQKIDEVHVCGLATDYCVSFTALDGARLLPGVKVVFIEDASRGIAPESIQAAKDKMAAAGIETRNTADIVPRAKPAKRVDRRPSP
jgi:nicotinamidase/pyrazinamidase